MPVGYSGQTALRREQLLGGNCEIGDCTAAVARQWPTNNNRGMVFSVRSMGRCYKQDELVVSHEGA
jgi:hypothetical protein